MEYYNTARQLAESMCGKDHKKVASVLFSLGELKLGADDEAGEGLAKRMS